MLNSEKLFLQALKYYDVKEVEGIGVNQLIASWISWAMPWVKSEEDIDSRYAWCAIFISKMMNEIDLLPNSTPIIRARKFAEIGTETNTPVRGDIIVLSRGVANGHVALLDQVLPNGKYRLYGGNQQNKVGYNIFNPDRVISKRTLNV